MKCKGIFTSKNMDINMIFMNTHGRLANNIHPMFPFILKTPRSQYQWSQRYVCVLLPTSTVVALGGV